MPLTRPPSGKRGPQNLRIATCQNTLDYTDEQREWLKAMMGLAKRLRRRPTMPEVLREAIRLGYRKGEAAVRRDTNGGPRP